MGSSEAELILRSVVSSIHRSPSLLSICTAGGCANALSWLLSLEPGATSTVLEAVAPHAREAMEAYLDAPVQARGSRVSPSSRVNRFVSPQTASRLAQRALGRAVALSRPGAHVTGIAATCALVSEESKRGGHRCHFAAEGRNGRGQWTLELEKGRRSRWEEDRIASMAFMKAVAAACQVSENIDLGLHSGAESFRGEWERIDLKRAIQMLVEGGGEEEGKSLQIIEISGEGDVIVGATYATLLLPGSFNPLHDGHRRLLEAAEKVIAGDDGTSTHAAFELSVSNPDKGTLRVSDIERRVQQFTQAGLPVVLSRCPLFSDKASCLGGRSFVVGYDTAVRIVDPKYYGGQAGLRAAMLDLNTSKCNFIVGGRKDASSGRWYGLADMTVPEGFEHMFTSIPESDFRVDISSTELRARGQSLL